MGRPALVGMQPVSGDDGVLGEAGHLAHVVDGLAALVEAGGAVEHEGAGRHVQVAEVGVALQAGLAAATGGDKGEDDLVAGLGEGNAGADLFDRAGALVAEDGGEGDVGVAVHKVAVAAADAGGAYFDQHLAGLGFVQVHVFDHQGLTIFVQNGSLHLGAS